MSCGNPENCAEQPWCPECSPCGPPGGGGAFYPAPLAYDRPVWLGDHGQFASWISKRITCAQVVQINKDGTVDINVIFPDGSRFIEPGVIVTNSESLWSKYLRDREVAQKYRRDALKAACEEFAKLGHSPMRSIYCDGHYYPGDFDFRNVAIVVETNHDKSVNIHALMRGQLGTNFVKSVPVKSKIELPIWLQARQIWIPIRSRYFDEAQAKIDKYLGGAYSV